MVRKKVLRIVNLDPSAEHLAYDADIDLRELISTDDVQEELEFGPNGGLLYAMEYLQENLSWLTEQLDEFAGDEEYFLFDCPGQIELYIHHPVMRALVDNLQVQQGIRLCGVFVIDSTFIRDSAKFVSASLMTLNTMVHLELPHVNVLSKVDLLERAEQGELLEQFLDNDVESLLPDLESSMHPRYKALNVALVQLLEEYKMVSYAPLNPNDEESLDVIAHRINDMIQYYEAQEVNDKALDEREAAEVREQEQQEEAAEREMEEAQKLFEFGSGPGGSDYPNYDFTGSGGREAGVLRDAKFREEMELMSIPEEFGELTIGD